MGRFKYLFLAVVAVTGLIGATPIDPGAQLPPITALAVTVRGGNVVVDGYAAPELRERVVAVVGAMQSGTARLTEQSLELSGVASASADYGAELEALQDGLPQSVAAEFDVLVIDASPVEADLCARMFESVSALPAQFDETGILMRSASLPMLDRIVDYAQDCNESQIELVGHSDSTGPEAANLALSLTRAQRVAEYLVARGIDRERLQVSAAGSAEPVADNATRLGRERNRRVEFRLSP